ncbi:10490_t:CDS:1, partial [Entrophospora sp. SA101]
MTFPRYIRVNTLKTTVDKVINQFIREGYKLEYSNDDDNDLSKL